jgi:hypothetical protein
MGTIKRKGLGDTLFFVFTLSMCFLGLLNTAFSSPTAMGYYGTIRIDGGTNLSAWAQLNAPQPIPEPTTMLLLGLGLAMMGLAVAVWRFKN